MTTAQFRITGIAFDDNEDVAEVTAAVSTDTLQAIKTMVGVFGVEPTPAGAQIRLSAVAVTELFTAAGNMQPADPRHSAVDPVVYDSLYRVVYGFMREED